MRNISAEALTKLGEKTGIEPLLILEVQWTDTNSTKYCDKKLDGIHGLILSRSTIEDIIKVDFGGNSSNISVTLDDTDGHLKELLDTVDINKRQCIIYQYFSGLELSDAFEIFRGEIHSPIVWSEGQRTLSFDIISRIFHREVGFSPEEGQFTFVPEELIANVWPLGFGTPEHVPATQMFTVARGTVLNFGGIPDYTLSLKKQLIQKRLDEVTEAYDYYTELITTVRKLEVSGQQLQRDYANHCVAYSELRQIIADISENFEDISKQIDILSKDFDEPVGDLPRDEIVDSVISLNAYRDELLNLLQNLYSGLDDFKLAEDQYRYRTKLLKFEINFINTLNKKRQQLILDYNNFERQLTIVNQFINNQSTLYLNLISITNGDRFQENTNLTFETKRLLFTGSISDGDITVNAIQPTYNGIALTQGARQSDALDTFWLQSADTDLSNMYIYTSEGYIAKVTQQEGTKCIIQLPKKNKSPRQRQRRVDYSNDEETKELFDTTLSRLLTGGETEEEIAQIASYVPKTINPEVHRILTGGNTQIVVKIKKRYPHRAAYNISRNTEGDDFNKTSYFHYKGADTFSDNFSPSTGAAELKTIIDALAPWLDVTVTMLPEDTDGDLTLYTGFIIDINDNLNMHDLELYGYLDQENVPPDAKPFQTEGQYSEYIVEYTGASEKKVFLYMDKAGFKNNEVTASGFIKIYLNGKPARIDIDLNASAVKQAIYDQLGDNIPNIEVTGDPISTSLTTNDYEPLTIEIIGDEYASIYIDRNVFDSDYNPEGLSLTYDEDAVKPVLGPPKLNIEYIGTLKKYTRQEIENLIRSGLGGSVAGELFVEAKKVIADLLIKRKTTLINGLADKDIDEAINKAEKQLRDFADSDEFKKLKFDIRELYKIYPEGVYETLYEQELLGFLEFVSASRQLDVEVDAGDSYEFTAITMGDIKEASPVILPRWLEPISNNDNETRRLQLIEALPNSTEPFYVDVGDVITLANTYQEKWVCNILPSTIKAVYAYRTVSGLRRLTPVPSSYYSKNENEDFGEYQCTTITMVRPLEEYQENWEQGLYVTYESSVGPNLVDVIEWLITKYSTLSIDNDSFDGVRDLVEYYPVDFALFQKYDLIDLVSKIAWQARCSIWVNGATVYLRYLPAEPDSITTVTRTDVEQGSLSLTFTETDDLITKYIAKWKPNYVVNGDYKIVVRRNLSKFNEITDEQDYFIYKHRFLVYKSLTFWLIRRANAWRKVSFNLFLNKLMIETNDCITLDIGTHITNSAVKCIVESAVYDPNSNTINLTCWLPVLANSKEYYKFSWPKDLTEEDVFPTLEDIVSGNAGNPINFSVPIETDYTAIDNAILDKRPDDFGTPKVYDSADDLPKLTTKLDELNYKFKDSEAFLLEVGDDGIEEEEIVLEPPKLAAKVEPEKFLFGRIIDEVAPEDDLTTKSGEDVTNGNSTIDIELKLFNIALANGRVIRASPLDQNIDKDTVLKNTKVFLIKDEFQAYKFWLPSEMGSSEGVIS